MKIHGVKFEGVWIVFRIIFRRHEGCQSSDGELLHPPYQPTHFLEGLPSPAHKRFGKSAQLMDCFDCHSWCSYGSAKTFEDSHCCGDSIDRMMIRECEGLDHWPRVQGPSFR